VGDGAGRIADPVEERLGQNGSHLLDFFHVRDSLDDNAQAIATAGQTAQAWRETQKGRLKRGQARCVLDILESHQGNQIGDAPALGGVSATPRMAWPCA
jgi:hypothetical protein